MRLEARVLEGSCVRLEPLGRQHLDGLRAAIHDGELWKLRVTTVPEPPELEDFLARAQERYAQSVEMPFATIDKRSGRVAGSTRFIESGSSQQARGDRVHIPGSVLATDCDQHGGEAPDVDACVRTVGCKSCRAAD